MSPHKLPYEADDKTEAQRDLVMGQSHTASECGPRAQTVILSEPVPGPSSISNLLQIKAFPEGMKFSSAFPY